MSTERMNIDVDKDFAVKDLSIREQIRPMAEECIQIVEDRGNLRNCGRIQIENYAYHIPGTDIATFEPYIQLKAMRLRSHLERKAANHEVDGLRDYLETLQDLVNYCLFELALWQK